MQNYTRMRLEDFEQFTKFFVFVVFPKHVKVIVKQFAAHRFGNADLRDA